MSKSGEKSFGIIFFIFFGLIALWPLLKNEPMRIWSLALSVIFLVSAFLMPKLLKPLNLFWIKLGEILGKLISPIVLASIFFIVVTPMSMFIKMLGKDLLKLKFSKKTSYWIKRDKNINSMDKQF